RRARRSCAPSRRAPSPGSAATAPNAAKRRSSRARRLAFPIPRARRTGRRTQPFLRTMSHRQTTDFLLYDWLDAESLTQRPRFADHSRETFDSVLDTCEKIAREKFAPFNRIADTEEPWFDGERVHLPESSHAASRAYVESGMLAAA